MTWDFAETNPFASSGGTIDAQVEWLAPWGAKPFAGTVVLGPQGVIPGGV